ncbi:MAG: flagellar basal body rod protein FlgB [Nitrospiraceae bacterium]|nr:flagellar basal body rod protein FlgB [Nitrospiraceae bacterium]
MTGAEGLLERFIRFAMKRQGILAGNIANVATPGYKAMDINFEDFLTGATLPLAETGPGQMQAAAEPGLDASVRVDDSAPWKDGNNVQMDTEVAKMNENALLFEGAMKLLGNRMDMYRSALKR